MMIIFIRSAIIFIVLLIVMRLMGKRQIGEMQPFELVITLVIAELACIPMADVSIPLLYGIAAILALFVLHQIMALLERGGNLAKKTISGKPSIVINREGINFKELKKNDLDLEDLIESMRSAGYFALDDLEYGIFEANGKFSALEKKDLDKKQPALSYLLVNEGKLNHANLKLTKLGETFIPEFLREQDIKKLKDVDAMTVDNLGKVYLQEKGKKYRTVRVELPEGSEW